MLGHRHESAKGILGRPTVLRHQNALGLVDRGTGAERAPELIILLMERSELGHSEGLPGGCSVALKRC